MNIKSIILIATSILILTGAAFAAVPPAKVTKAFEAKFANASDVKWGKESAKEWEAEFTFEGVKTSANFSTDGSWVETESEVKVSDLPDAVAASIIRTHPNATVLHAYRIESARNGISYEAEIKAGKKKMEVILKEDGSSTR